MTWSIKLLFWLKRFWIALHICRNTVSGSSFWFRASFSCKTESGRPRDDKRLCELVLTKTYIYHTRTNNCNCLELRLSDVSAGIWNRKEPRLNKSQDEKSVFPRRNQTMVHPTISDKDRTFNWQQNRWRWRQKEYINIFWVNRSL